MTTRPTDVRPVLQAIRTVFHGPTNHRGARIKATAAAGSVTVHWDYAYDVEANHRIAACALREKLSWLTATHGALVGGQLADGSYVWVMLGREQS